MDDNGVALTIQDQADGGTIYRQEAARLAGRPALAIHRGGGRRATGP